MRNYLFIVFLILIGTGNCLAKDTKDIKDTKEKRSIFTNKSILIETIKKAISIESTGINGVEKAQHLVLSSLKAAKEQLTLCSENTLLSSICLKVRWKKLVFSVPF